MRMRSRKPTIDKSNNDEKTDDDDHPNISSKKTRRRRRRSSSRRRSRRTATDVVVVAENVEVEEIVDLEAEEDVESNVYETSGVDTQSTSVISAIDVIFSTTPSPFVTWDFPRPSFISSISL
ncbi:unnamed protein product [Caenorhabditis nigoni]